MSWRGGRHAAPAGPPASCAAAVRRSVGRACSSFHLRTFRHPRHFPSAVRQGADSIWQHGLRQPAPRRGGATARRTLSLSAPVPTATTSSTLAQRQAGGAVRLFD